MATLVRCAPEAQGISSRALLEFVEALDRDIHELHSFMLLRRGAVVAEGWWAPYAPERPHMLFSLSKSFTSSAVGLAAAEGLLSLDDRVLDFFPEDAPAAPDANLARMRVRDLLCMGTGHAEDSTGYMRARQDGCWKKGFLARPVEYEPGTHFVYNSGATYMLSAIVQKVSGQTVLEYLTPRLFAPLGIENPTWENSPEGINTGGWGLSIKTEDIARFGQMLLQKGVWQGNQILPEAWVAEATAKHIDNATTSTNSDWQQGYGYQFWRCQHGAFRGDGAFGQFCIVMPDQEAVLAVTAGTDDMQAILDQVWNRLLPVMGAKSLPDDPEGQAALTRKLTGLALCPPQWNAAAEPEPGGVFDLEPVDVGLKALELDFGTETTRLRFIADEGEQVVTLGHSRWIEGMGRMDGQYLQPAAAAGTWEPDGKTFTALVRFYETPFYETFHFHLDGDRLTMEHSVNVSLFGSTEYPRLTGLRRKA